jgi:hypothetical protein
MTQMEKFKPDEKKTQLLEEICENTRAIRRVTNRILDHLHEYGRKKDYHGGVVKKSGRRSPSFFLREKFSSCRSDPAATVSRTAPQSHFTPRQSIFSSPTILRYPPIQ